MNDPVVIALHADSPPGFGQVLGWLIAGNFFVLTTTGIIFVLLPWFAGHQPTLDANTLGLAGATGVALLVGFLFVAFRRYQQQGVGLASAELRLGSELAELRPRDGAPISCPREALVVRPVHAHETLRGVDYYMGPAIQVTLGDATWVLARLDGSSRWGTDPPAVDRIDWICGADAWARLLDAEELGGLLVAYKPEVDAGV